MKSPFKFLDSYELKDRDIFFGRNEEIEELYAMLFKTPLLLVFGLSGTGKTSLVSCGLASKYSGPNWFPFFIRRGNNINDALRKALSDTLPAGETYRTELHENVSVLFRNYLRPVYLIFDQFEELFILGDLEEQLEFARQIKGLVEAKLPAKIILIMREEYIGQLYLLEKEIPSLYDFRLRVEPMGFKKVKEVVLGSFSAFNIELEDRDNNIEQIYDNISAGKSGVQLPYLQVYLDLLWREDFSKTFDITSQAFWLERMAERPPEYPTLKLTAEEIETFGNIGDVLARFLREQENALRDKINEKFPALPKRTIRKILDLFVTGEGTKRPIRFQRDNDKYIILDQDALSSLSNIRPEVLDFALDYLENVRLIRDRDNALELAHDSLAALIDKERSDEERLLNAIRNRIKNAREEYLLSVKSNQEYIPNVKLIQDIEEHIDNLELAPNLLDFYHISRRILAQIEEAKLEEAERKARAEEAALRFAEEERLRMVAEKQRKRAITGAIAAAVFALLAFVLAGWALDERSKALKAEKDAVINYQSAQEERKKAEEKGKEAERNWKLANENYENAQEQQRLAQQSEQKAKFQQQLAQQSELKVQKALADLKKEQNEKEKLQISAKSDIVEAFLTAGYCNLAQKAFNDLKEILDHNKEMEPKQVQIITEELTKKLKTCKQ